MNETTTVVSRCGATSCRFNDSQQCTAGQIEVSMSGAAKAECLTFSPKSEGQGTQPSAQQ